jgi:hypothetical protein
MSHLRHTSDKTCNAKALPNKAVELTGKKLALFSSRSPRALLRHEVASFTARHKGKEQ